MNATDPRGCVGCSQPLPEINLLLHAGPNFSNGQSVGILEKYQRKNPGEIIPSAIGEFILSFHPSPARSLFVFD